jgi:putative transposase
MPLLTRSRLRAGEVILIEGLRHTLLRLFGKGTWQVEVQTTREIKTYEHDDLLSLYCYRRMVFAEDWRDPQLEPVRKKVAWSKAEKDLTKNAKRRLAYVKAVLELPKAAGAIREAIQATAKSLRHEKAPHPVTVLKWRRKYEVSGRDPISLVERDDAKGRRPIELPLDTLLAVQTAIDTTYLTRTKNSLKHTFDIAKALVEEKNKKALEEGGEQENLIRLPSMYALRQQIARLDAYHRDVRRKGRDEADRLHRSTESHYIVRGPLQLAEMDHSPIDALVIDSRTFIPLGRPIVTVCIDVFTRAVLGLYITFDKASFRSVAHCLKHSLLPKLDMKFPEIEIKNPWFAYGTMARLSVDNGQEFHSDEFDALCYVNDIDIAFAKRKTGWHKPHIERFLGTLNRGLIHTIPGTTFGNVIEKGDYNPKKDAVLTLDELKAYLCKWVCDDYSTNPHCSTGLMPISAWEKHIAPQDIPLLAAPIDMTPFIGYREPSRVVSENGVQHKNLQYNSPSLRRLREQYGDTFKAEIRWDSADLGSIWVVHPEEPEPIQVPALDADYASGLSLYQHERIQAYVRQVIRREDSRSTRLEAKLEIARKIQGAMERAGRGGNYKSGGLGVKVDIGRYTQGADGRPMDPVGAELVHSKPAKEKQPIPAAGDSSASNPATATPACQSDQRNTPKPTRKPKKFAPIYNGTLLTGESHETLP